MLKVAESTVGMHNVVAKATAFAAHGKPLGADWNRDEARFPVAQDQADRPEHLAS